MGNEMDLTRYLSELAGWVWVPRAIEEALAVPWAPVLLLGVLGVVLLWRAYWRLYRSTAIPVVGVFILIGYLLVALLLLDVTAAPWQVQEPSEVVRSLLVALALGVAGRCSCDAHGDRLGSQGLCVWARGE